MSQVCFASLVGTSAIDQRASRADLHTGAAGNTGAFAKGHVVVGNQDAAGAAFLKAKRRVADQFGASTHTAAAEDAAVVIEDEIGMRRVHKERLVSRGDGPVGHILVVGCLLQFTVAVGILTVHAEVVTFTEKHREDEFPRGFGFVRVGVNHHAVIRGHNTRWLEGACAFDFHQAETAGAVGDELGVVAKRRHVKASFADRVKDCCAGFDFNGLSVNG